MKYRAWASKQLIVLVALALATAPAGKAAKSPSSSRLDGKTGGMERVSAPPAASDPIAAAQEAAGQTSRQPSPIVPEPSTVKVPLVTYVDGQLTVNAENALLSDIMKAVRQVLGADIDLPEGVVDQRIWVHFGPGPASRVLRDLLDGTEFNYVIQASENDPDGIRSVLLTPRSKSTGAEKAEPPERSAMRRMPGHESDASNPTDSENPPSQPVASVDPSQATPAASPAVPLADGSSSSARMQNTPANFVPSDARPTPAADPNEQIQQLQSLYQQRRQLQMQQNQRPAAQN